MTHNFWLIQHPQHFIILQTVESLGSAIIGLERITELQKRLHLWLQSLASLGLWAAAKKQRLRLNRRACECACVLLREACLAAETGCEVSEIRAEPGRAVRKDGLQKWTSFRLHWGSHGVCALSPDLS